MAEYGMQEDKTDKQGEQIYTRYNSTQISMRFILHARNRTLRTNLRYFLTDRFSFTDDLLLKKFAGELTGDAHRFVESRRIIRIANASLLPATECMLDTIDVPLAIFSHEGGRMPI